MHDNICISLFKTRRIFICYIPLLKAEDSEASKRLCLSLSDPQPVHFPYLNFRKKSEGIKIRKEAILAPLTASFMFWLSSSAPTPLLWGAMDTWADSPHCWFLSVLICTHTLTVGCYGYMGRLSSSAPTPPLWSAMDTWAGSPHFHPHPHCGVLWIHGLTHTPTVGGYTFWLSSAPTHATVGYCGCRN